MIDLDPTAQEVRDLRDSHAIPFSEGKRIITGLKLKRAIATVETIDDLKIIIAKIVDTSYPKLR